MRIVMLAGSPKREMSLSAALVGELSRSLGDQEKILFDSSLLTIENTQETAAKITATLGSAEVFIVAFPLYVDAIPAHLLRLLEAIAEERRKSDPIARYLRNDDSGEVVSKPDRWPRVYAMVNCGFYESENSRSASRMLQLWSEDACMIFAGSLLIGAGGIGPRLALGRGMGRRVGKALKMLTSSILQGEKFEAFTVEPNVSRRIYMGSGNKWWAKIARRNGIGEDALRSLTNPSR